ncbi:uncharacterized protein MYCFIDRAFT_45250 [Pseudocercospora fijiensis CIRAD86]|uniref:Major facilitator superfamily (MFS) profile domain-containing protein n=1 Tax=Pseudocercospora fijiensis (strain CIRAD86) TaxID=383855 RepID=M2Z959_PSEFD|nr:uncharacterized protein MYCFIDRAFT_45250 [Pseudocercospora fijiensis CIRAD86]EME86325.1 hypothetical protein MYCFIDRAFT_45250 [Pseudocercospora fijiensis CIRAD86]
MSAKQEIAAPSSAAAEVRIGTQKPTGTFTGDNTDSGATDTRCRSHAGNDEDEKLTDPEEKIFDSRQSSKTPSRRPSEQHDGNEERTIVSFTRGDPENPYNWSLAKKLYVTWTCVALVMNSTIGSSLPSGATQELAAYFNITNQSLLVLPVSIYLIGYVLGPLVFAPMSESFGRKWVVIGTFVIFTAFQIGCALAPTFSGFIVMRLLVGIGSSTPISVIGGVYADIYDSPKSRGRAVTLFMAATTWGPLAGPIISGFVSTVSWRWTFWIGAIIAGVTWPFVIFMPETYGPILLKRKAERLRQETGKENIVAPIELDEQSWGEFCTITLTRPIRMFLFEWIVLFSCLYLSVAYAIFYIYFQAYPIIFQGTYGFNAGEEGLAFLPIGVGSMIAGGIYLWWEHYLAKAKARTPPPIWSQQEEFVRLPVALLGAPLFAIALFWLGWTARPSMHWIVPTLSALPFGIGFLLIFMALINYIVDAYEIFAASAMGAASCSRSIFGVVIPFAARPMYRRLGIAWSCTLLGFLSVVMGIVPFVFIKYGAKIRANSKWCQELKRQQAEKEEKQRELEERDTATQHLNSESPEMRV